MWEFVICLILLVERDKIVEFEVFYGNGDFLGYVLFIDDNDFGRWWFVLVIDVVEELEVINFKDFFIYVIIYEYGYVLSLNDE